MRQQASGVGCQERRGEGEKRRRGEEEKGKSGMRIHEYQAKQILRDAGVDLTKPDAIEAALQRFNETVTGLEALLPRLQAEEAAKQPQKPGKPTKKKGK